MNQTTRWPASLADWLLAGSPVIVLQPLLPVSIVACMTNNNNSQYVRQSIFHRFQTPKL
jgi:hypothetical protein